MKTIFTLFLISNMFLTSTAQLVLNELYTSPGAGKHEFFELYNTSASSSPVSLAGYSIISYFEESAGVKGFYVLDLPDLEIAPKAYLVGSSATTFNYQGVTGSTSTHFSWNDLAFLNLNNGYLKKWVAGNNVPVGIDGNAEYDEQVLPADFNDFLNRIPGGGASYGVFIYKDGELANAFLGGESGHSVPAFISSMPVLNADFVGVGNYGINFADINSAVAEYVISDAGSDNGFIRNKDGLCGAWQKSSSSAQHTPNVANGVLSGEVSSAVSLWATITKGYNTTDSATLSYKILSAPDGILPVIFDIYVDNGTPGVIDGFDTYIASREINDLTDTLFTQLFLPYNANIIIGVRTLAGCYNSISLTPNIGFLLPIKMLHFNGLIDNRTVRLQWSVTDNNAESRFEVQKSEDGITFKTTGIVFSSDKVGSEQYSFKEITENEPGGYYRIKTYHADHSVTYSKVIRLISQETTVKRNIRLINNPVDSYLGFTFEAVTNMPSEISIYNMSGAKIYSTQVATHKGSNMVTLAMGGRIYTGVYVLEVRNGQQKTAVKIIKK